MDTYLAALGSLNAAQFLFKRRLILDNSNPRRGCWRLSGMTKKPVILVSSTNLRWTNAFHWDSNHNSPVLPSLHAGLLSSCVGAANKVNGNSQRLLINGLKWLLKHAKLPCWFPSVIPHPVNLHDCSQLKTKILQLRVKQSDICALTNQPTSANFSRTNALRAIPEV